MPPDIRAHVPIPGTRGCDLTGTRVLADEGSSWITQGDPKSNSKCLLGGKQGGPMDEEEAV